MPHLRTRVNDFFCYDDTWKMVMSRLARESDAVLMDLRGFSRRNAGCIFELSELARMVPAAAAAPMEAIAAGWGGSLC